MYNGGCLSGDMTGVPPPAEFAVDQNTGLMQGLDVDMMGTNMDFSQMDPDNQSQPISSYNTSIPLQQHQHQPQQPMDSSVDATDTYVMQNTMSGVGAGPLPTGFGVHNMKPTGSTLTEFTKRRNWSQRVLDELRDFLHILTPDGRIMWVSPSCKHITGYEPVQLVGRSMNELIHPDDSGIFIREFNESIASGHPLRFFYRFRKEDGSWIIFESHGHPHLSTDTTFGPNGSAVCSGFFMMARPYPTKNAALLDSFLEHKIENERLTKRIAELKREEQEEEQMQDRHWSKLTEGHSSISQSETQRTEAESLPFADSRAMPPPAKPVGLNTALTEKNLGEALSSIKADSINDKMARYEGATHLETIEMLTGLRYRDGERSQGISTGDASPLLIRGDVGIQISLDKDQRGSIDKKKKLKIADEYVCTDCGTLDSPEWRKGPNGPKTLCNACGLRWAKKEKKRQGGSTSTSHPPPSMPVQASINSIHTNTSGTTTTTNNS